jgi:serpin B
MKKVLSVLIVIVIMGLTACSQPASAGILQSEKPRITEPQVSQGDLATLVDGNSEFAFDLYQVLGDSGGNLFYSPYSISQALAMTYAGARGDTEKQMADTLNFLLSQGFSTSGV